MYNFGDTGKPGGTKIKREISTSFWLTPKVIIYREMT
jgi:hypothetical protein